MQIWRAPKSGIIFRDMMIALIGLAGLGAGINQTARWIWTGQHHFGGAHLIVFAPVFGLMGWFGIMDLFKLRGRDIRLEADELGLRWVYIPEEKLASSASQTTAKTLFYETQRYRFQEIMEQRLLFLKISRFTCFF